MSLLQVSLPQQPISATKPQARVVEPEPIEISVEKKLNPSQDTVQGYSPPAQSAPTQAKPGRTHKSKT
jgi:hypothetical protein